MTEDTITSSRMNDNTIVIAPGQQLDNDNAHKMVNAISQAQSEGYTYIILDMNSLEFISSSGVGSILGSVEVSREAGGDIILCNVSEGIRNILKVLDLIDFLTFADSAETALQACSTKG